MDYIIGGLVLVVLVEGYVIWGCCRKINRCCKLAEEAWQWSNHLEDWFKAANLKHWLLCINDAVKDLTQRVDGVPTTDCGDPGSDPTWPPEDPGDFPM